ncbi:hypothetical protein BDR04DRAFT_1107746 [Suillus decipiens]|nr:hypothetical protein BDR04DRAFT_1107746 [Suillus decipiens]
MSSASLITVSIIVSLCQASTPPCPKSHSDYSLCTLYYHVKPQPCKAGPHLGTTHTAVCLSAASIFFHPASNLTLSASLVPHQRFNTQLSPDPCGILRRL